VWWTTRRRFTERELRGLDRVCEQVGFFLRNARLYEQAERNRQRLEVLNDVSRRLAAVHDPEEVLTVIVNEAARLVGAEAAGLRLLDGDDLVVGARTEAAAAVMSRPRIKVGESLSGRVVATGSPVVVEDLAADTRHDPAHKRGALEQGLLGFIGVPLRGRLRPRRCVSADRRRHPARAGHRGWRGRRAPPAGDARRRPVLRGLEEPSPHRGAIRRGPGVGAAARSRAARRALPALAAV